MDEVFAFTLPGSRQDSCTSYPDLINTFLPDLVLTQLDEFSIESDELYPFEDDCLSCDYDFSSKIWALDLIQEELLVDYGCSVFS